MFSFMTERSNSGAAPSHTAHGISLITEECAVSYINVTTPKYLRLISKMLARATEAARQHLTWNSSEVLSLLTKSLHKAEKHAYQGRNVATLVYIWTQERLESCWTGLTASRHCKSVSAPNVYAARFTTALNFSARLSGYCEFMIILFK